MAAAFAMTRVFTRVGAIASLLRFMIDYSLKVELSSLGSVSVRLCNSELLTRM